ncbi:MlaD family protein [Nocardia sp. NPDC050406]|uniref:MlaD family protein n=1 Tax=Nocardia sp. NPDC050406 TaxID=3364318 RepID=UPI0037BDD473
MNISHLGARLTGLVAVVLAVCTGVAVTVVGQQDRSDGLRLQLRTDQVGDGVTAGTHVIFDGVDVGRVTAVDPAANGRQLVSVELDRAQVTGLTDTVQLEYAARNLFGITAVALRSGNGGQALRDGSILDLTGRTADATMGTLLRSLTETSDKVFTPELTAMLTRISADLRAFTPILRAMIDLGRTVADTQRYASSYLIDQYAQLLDGTGQFASSTFVLLHNVLEIEPFVTDRPGYDAGVAMINDELFPGIASTLHTAHTQLGGYADLAAPLLAAIAATVTAPQRSQAELTELLSRLDRLFADTPQGPRLQVSIGLRGLPGLGVPLLGQSAFAALTAPEGPR